MHHESVKMSKDSNGQETTIAHRSRASVRRRERAEPGGTARSSRRADVDVDAEITMLSPERRPLRSVPSSVQCFARSAASRWEAAPAARQAEIDGHGMTSPGRVIVSHVTALSVHCRRVVLVHASLRMWAAPRERVCAK
jgi:hypothetical protein